MRCAALRCWPAQVVRSDLSVEERAQLLQFTTGTSRVPVQGFKALQVARCRCRCRCMCARARAFVRARASVLLTRGVRAGGLAGVHARMDG
jgi:hypothetical protein